MNNIKVSVIIPVYNVEKYLKQCLDSVINQTFKNIEIIIVNDCSPDNSSQIIKEYQQKDNRIVLIDLKQNVGLGFARNEGIKVAKGDYVTFIDSDDWVTNDFVEVLYNTIEKYQYDVIAPDFYCYDNNTNKIYNSRQPECFYNINISTIKLKKKFLYFEETHYARKIFKLDFLKKNNILFKINKMEDTLFIWEIVLKTDKFMFIRPKLYYYRTNRENSILSTKKNEFMYNVNLFYNLKKLISQNNEIYKIFKPVLNSFIMKRLFVFSGKVSDEFTQNFDKIKKDLFEGKKTEFYHINTLKSRLTCFLFYIFFKFDMNFVYLSKFYIKVKNFMRCC